MCRTLQGTGGIENYKFHGILILGNEILISVHSNNNGGSRWVPIGGQFHGLKILDYDRDKKSILASYNNSVLWLPLHEPAEVRSEQVQKKAGKKHEISEVENIKDGINEIPLQIILDRKVNNYKMALYDQMLPQNHQYSKEKTSQIETTINSRIIDYTKNLRKKMNDINAGKSHTVPIGVARPKEGRVETRIWASDHIEIHGAPD